MRLDEGKQLEDGFPVLLPLCPGRLGAKDKVAHHAGPAPAPLVEEQDLAKSWAGWTLGWTSDWTSGLTPGWTPGWTPGLTPGWTPGCIPN